MTETTTTGVITTVTIATRSRGTKRKTRATTKEVSHTEKVAKRSAETATRTTGMTGAKSKRRRKW